MFLNTYKKKGDYSNTIASRQVGYVWYVGKYFDRGIHNSTLVIWQMLKLFQ